MSLNKFTIQKSFAISAGAGSGKTYTLSRRYINAVLGFDFFREKRDQDQCINDLKAAKIDEIVTMTYTEAAALEMKERIFALMIKVINFERVFALEQENRKDPEYKKDGDIDSIEMGYAELNTKQKSYVIGTLQTALESSGDARISTIHAYCLNLLKKHADIAKFDSKVDVIKDAEKENLINEIIFSTLNDDQYSEVVLELSESINMSLFDDLIKKYLNDGKFRENLKNFTQESIDIDHYKALIKELYPLPGSETIEEELDPIKASWLDDFIGSYEVFEALKWKDVNPPVKAPQLGKKYPTLTQLKETYESCQPIYASIDPDKEHHFFELIGKIKNLLEVIKVRYDQELKVLGKLDFDTIITATLPIVEKIESSIKYFMVDEFQDTNEVQYDIVKASCNDKTNLFVVGDSKQSIYAFQGAEIEVFNGAVNDTSRFELCAQMSDNHRSDGAVLDSVNRIFDRLLVLDNRLKLIKQNYEAQPQALNVFNSSRKNKGSFKFLITPKPYKNKEEKEDEDSDVSEYATIAKFIENISTGKLKAYEHIKEKIDAKQKAVAIVFDAKSKMLELKSYLTEHGIECKVSASENFYHTKEITDIYHLLKAIEILTRKKSDFSAVDSFYLAGAMRSNILHLSDNEIKQHIENKTQPQKLKKYVELSNQLTLAQLVKSIYDDSRIIDIYAHFSDVEQRVANLNKFLELALEFEVNKDATLYSFVTLLEKAVYFSETAEDEAFYKSDNVESIELCTIHSTKGLAYPMVILANAQKPVYSQIQSDAIKHNNFTLADGTQKEIVGFKVQGYEPLSLRVLKAVDKLKHLAEKKRLLYVALTRAEHDVVISARLDEKSDQKSVTLREDSYLHMIAESLSAPSVSYNPDEKEEMKQELFTMSGPFDYIKELFEVDETLKKESINQIAYAFEPICFEESSKQISATQSDENQSIDLKAAQLGTTVHKLIELYWRELKEGDYDLLCQKEHIVDPEDKSRVVKALDSFLASDVYAILKSGAQAHFELPFNDGKFQGFIDLVYYDEAKNGWVIIDFKTGTQNESAEKKYQSQLDFYRSFLENQNLNCVDAKLLWL